MYEVDLRMKVQGAAGVSKKTEQLSLFGRLLYAAQKHSESASS